MKTIFKKFLELLRDAFLWVFYEIVWIFMKDKKIYKLDPEESKERFAKFKNFLYDIEYRRKEAVEEFPESQMIHIKSIREESKFPSTLISEPGSFGLYCLLVEKIPHRITPDGNGGIYVTALRKPAGKVRIETFIIVDEFRQEFDMGGPPISYKSLIYRGYGLQGQA